MKTEKIFTWIALAIIGGMVIFARPLINYLTRPDIDPDAPLFPAKFENGKYGYIDASGRPVIEARFDGADSFYEGLALVWIVDKAGYINRTGEIEIDPQFDGASHFSEGISLIRIGHFQTGKYGYID